MPSISDIINKIAPISQYLAANNIQDEGLYGGGTDNELPRKIYMVRKNCKWLYDLAPTDDTLIATSNYLYALCSKYALVAANISGVAGSVASIAVGSSANIVSPIRITSSDFIDATNWAGQNSINQQILPIYVLQVFWDDAQIFLEENIQWERTATGINITEPGFDSTNNNYNLYIFISRP